VTSNGVPVEIRPFIGAEADEAELRRCHELFVANTQRTFPGFPPQPFASFAARMRSERSLQLGLRSAWVAREGGSVIGFATVLYSEHASPDLAVPRAYVDEAHRRRGIGTALLREIVADARARGRTTLCHEQIRIGSEGEGWVRALGFVDTQNRSWQMLHVASVDPALWDVAVPAGFRLVRWADAAPDDLVAAFAKARNAIADAPTGDSSYREPEWTVERVREVEARIRAGGDELRFVVAVHQDTGDVAALTGLRLDPRRVDLCWQRDTAVVGGHRGRGLGRAVKAAMMRWLVADIPELGRVITNTAAENAYMIRVNEQIGYVHYADIGVFEASVEQVDAALEMPAAIPGPRRESASEEEPVG